MRPEYCLLSYCDDPRKGPPPLMLTSGVQLRRQRILPIPRHHHKALTSKESSMQPIQAAKMPFDADCQWSTYYLDDTPAPSTFLSLSHHRDITLHSAISFNTSHPLEHYKSVISSHVESYDPLGSSHTQCDSGGSIDRGLCQSGIGRPSRPQPRTVHTRVGRSSSMSSSQN